MSKNQSNAVDSAEFSSYQPADHEIQSALAANLIKAIPSAALSLAAMYVLLAIAHSVLLAPEHKVILCTVAALSAVAFFVVYLLTREDGALPEFAHGFAGLFGLIGLINSLLHVAITGDPLQSSNIMLVNVAIGAFFLSKLSLIHI